MRICKPIQKVLHPIVKAIYFDFVPIYTGAKRLSHGTDLCDGKLLVNQTIPSGNMMGETGRFDIYLPSAYVGSGKKYPVLYLLHGLGYNPGIWESRMNITRLVDEFVRDGAIEPILLSRILSMFDAYVHTDESNWIFCIQIPNSVLLPKSARN